MTWPLVADGNAVTTGNVTASTISGGSGLASVIFFSSSGANAEGWPTTSARNLDDYFEYQISPAAGYDLTLTSISFEHFTSKKASPGSVYYSTDGFSTENQLLTFTSLEGIPTATSQSVNIVVPNGQTLSIRIYVWRMFKTDTKFYNKNVILTGTASSSASSTLNVTPNIIDFGYVNVDSTSSEMSYEISGENLDGNPVTISAPTDFKVSLSSGTGFTSTVTLPYSGNTLPATTIYCLFQPLAADTEYNSIIGNSGGGATTQNVQVTGTTIVDCISGAVAVLSSIGVSNPENATGVADLDGATLTGNSGILTLDLTGDGSLASGGEVVVYWNSGHPSQAGSLLVEISEDAMGWTTLASYSVPSGGWTTQTIALSTSTRYVRFTSQNNWDVLIDAIEFDPPPSIICPVDVIDVVDPGLCTATNVNLGSPSVSDNCGIASVVNDAPLTFVLDTTVVTWTVTDIGGNTTSCSQHVIIVPEEEIDIEVEPLSNFCQSGGTGTTTISWNVNLLTGTTDWTYDYVISDGSTDVATGTNVSANGNITISYLMTNALSDKTYTLTITNAKDDCGISEADTSNNSDVVTVFAVPDTGEIIPD